MLSLLFTTSLETHALCRESDQILVAVSGGKDSMALLDLFRRSGRHIEAAHFNFRLRGEHSDKDEKLVSDYCARFGLKLHITSADTSTFARENGISIQLAARQLRYEWFNQLLSEQKLDYIATAHHLNDNLETLLLNITKGTGPKGLSGIPLKTHRIIRPLLYCSSDQIKEYLLQNQIEWREDESNQEDKYYRNRIRNQVIPQLKLINPGLENTFATNLQRFQSLNEIFSASLNEFISQIKEESGVHKIPVHLIQKTKGSALVLEEYLKAFGFNFQDVQSLLTITHSGRKILSSTHVLTLHRDCWFLAEAEVFLHEETIISEPGIYTISGTNLEIKAGSTDELHPDFSDPSVAYLDFEKVGWPLKIRAWKTGDRFIPFGMKGSKLISDFLQDRQADPSSKRNQLVVEDPNRIIWLPGQRTSEYCKITENTKKILCLKHEI